MKMNAMKFAIPLFVALAYGPAQAQILGPELASFAVLGASDVTSANVSNITGNLGSFPTAPTTAATNFNFITAGSFQPGTQGTAQTQLDTALAALPVYGLGVTVTGGSLDTFFSGTGGVIGPGTYSVPFLASGNITGNIVLDGGGSNTAVWNFVFEDSLITSTVSNVSVTDVGDGANVGVYWKVNSSATLDGPTFAGNVLAVASITTDGNLTMGCGRLLSATADVTLIGDTISAGCFGTLGSGSGGFDQGNSTAPIPEPEIYAMMAVGLGLLGWVGRRKKLKEAAAA